MILTFRPIKVWPEGWRDPARRRALSPFRSTYSATLSQLDHELRQLKATDVFLQVDATDRDLRLDGQLRADAKVNHPGVIVTIDTKRFGTLTYPCDAFQAGWKQPGWQANLRAVTLGLEALRKIERYGIAERGQQYAGFKELGSGIELGRAPMTVEQAATFLVEHGDRGREQGDPDALIDDPALVTLYFRDAAKWLHPDTESGDESLFKRLTEARDVLVREFGTGDR